jgi:hypothetical protein
MIVLDLLATLELSAASGLVCRGSELFVVADDELELQRYALDGTLVGRTRLAPGSLPEEAKARKRAKPDFEALAALPEGTLLAIGSCSTALRERAVGIGPSGIVDVDLGPLAAATAPALGGLNLEGAAVLGDSLVLLSRRTGSRGRNAVLWLALEQVLDALSSASPRLDAAMVVSIDEVDLGGVDGAAYGFTDVAVWQRDRHQPATLLFSAVAERTDDPVEDGACAGCVIGELDAAATLRWMTPVSPMAKVEGIALGPRGELFAVADADDRSVAAQLFRAALAARASPRP